MAEFLPLLIIGGVIGLGLMILLVVLGAVLVLGPRKNL